MLRDRLILTYAPLVKYVAGRLGSGLPAHVEEEDLVSYGLLGLIGAIERYDPDRDVKFETYAIARIKGAIIDELRSLDWVPRSVRARAREIERAMAALEAKLHRPPTDEEIAKHVGITVEELEDSLTDISRSSIAALDELWTIGGSGGDQIALIDTIEDTDAPAPESSLAGDRAEGGPRRGDRAPARAREARRHALLLRGADAPRDRRGARRYRVSRLPAPHEGDPAAEGPSLRRDAARRSRSLSWRLATRATSPPTTRSSPGSRSAGRARSKRRSRFASTTPSGRAGSRRKRRGSALSSANVCCCWNTSARPRSRACPRSR